MPPEKHEFTRQWLLTDSYHALEFYVPQVSVLLSVDFCLLRYCVGFDKAKFVITTLSRSETMWCISPKDTRWCWTHKI